MTLGSAGKTFSTTGWKVGWTVAPGLFVVVVLCLLLLVFGRRVSLLFIYCLFGDTAHFSDPIFKAHQWIPFCVSTPLQVLCSLASYFIVNWIQQEGVARAFEEAQTNGYFATLKTRFEGQRARFVVCLFVVDCHV